MPWLTPAQFFRALLQEPHPVRWNPWPDIGKVFSPINEIRPQAAFLQEHFRPSDNFCLTVRSADPFLCIGKLNPGGYPVRQNHHSKKDALCNAPVCFGFLRKHSFFCTQKPMPHTPFQFLLEVAKERVLIHRALTIILLVMGTDHIRKQVARTCLLPLRAPKPAQDRCSRLFMSDRFLAQIVPVHAKFFQFCLHFRVFTLEMVLKLANIMYRHQIRHKIRQLFRCQAQKPRR